MVPYPHATSGCSPASTPWSRSRSGSSPSAPPCRPASTASTCSPSTTPPHWSPTCAGGQGVLQVGPRRTFGYESVSFDTPDLTCYRLAAHRRPTRYKVRTRTCLDSGECWLEVKTRDRQGRTVEQRLPYDRATLGAAGRTFVRAALAAALTTGATCADLGALRPTLVTRYRRSTLLLPDDDSRLTVDTDLVCLDDDVRPLRLPDRAVVGTKTAGHASAVERMLWRRGHRPAQISTYGTGPAALHPELPAVKWRPVLRRHPFGAPLGAVTASGG